MDIFQSTEKYETWLRKHIQVQEGDLQLKHSKMAADLFQFFRATYYRWAEHWPDICPEPARAPSCLAVADLHVENFGTWRDDEGRLIWGINDFDEACPMAYTNDLVRLAASAMIAMDNPDQPTQLKSGDACDAILEGYQAAVAEGGRPFVLEEKHGWLRRLATSDLRDPEQFWKKLEQAPPYAQPLPGNVEVVLTQALPQKSDVQKISARVAGLGSLGRYRFVALASRSGGYVAREAKAYVPPVSAGDDQTCYYNDIVSKAIRCADPTLGITDGWVIRRLSPDCSRVELSELPKEHDNKKLLRSMGYETANVHLGSMPAATIAADLGKRPQGWLHDSARSMLDAIKTDWHNWKAKQVSTPSPLP
jgi:hypothetical protein